ncbi:rab9 effector protein [Anaeramoeba ignava]|uniref:Rab9 effector protein n=1 Tax=Anaeramoeba ignava TaxID=1746090 RepID=A0A9Q0L630_ANAIG|nr:rab9 effector protein [Anaeramoeba ignava]
MKKSNKKFIGWKQLIPITEEKPMEVAKSGIFFDSDQHKIYIFGGNKLNPTQESNQLFSFDLQNNKWEQIKPDQNKQPSIRSAHSMTGFKNKIWIFGGNMENEYYDDLWEFDTNLNQWTKIEFAGHEKKPSGRYSHSAIYHNGFIYLFGGFSNEGSRKNDLWRFNTLQKKWEEIPSIGEIPKARSSHTCHIYEDNLMIVGEWFLYDFPQNPSLFPSARFGSVGCAYSRSHFFLFGGQYENTLTYDEIWDFGFEQEIICDLRDFLDQKLLTDF